MKALGSLVKVRDGGGSGKLTSACKSLCGALMKESLRVAPKYLKEGGTVKVFKKESAHPYAHNINSSEKVTYDGAKRITISFDSETRTENGCDYVCFYKDTDRAEMFGEKYSGGKDGGNGNWPGFGGRPPLIIEASSFVLTFRTDGSVNDWGWKFTAKVEYDEIDIHSIPLHEASSNLKYITGCLKEGHALQVYPEDAQIKKIEKAMLSGSLSESELGPAELSAGLADVPDVTFEDKDVKAKTASTTSDDANKFVTLSSSTRVMPSPHSSESLAVLPIDSTVTVVEEEGYWLKIVMDPSDPTNLGDSLREGMSIGGIVNNQSEFLEGWVKRRDGDEEYLAKVGEDIAVPGVSYEVLDISVLKGGGFGILESEDDSRAGRSKEKAKKLSSRHPIWDVADSSNEDCSEIDSVFGYVASNEVGDKLTEMSSLSCSLSHTLSIKYAQLALTALTPMLSLEDQFDLKCGNIGEMLKFLKIVFLQQRDAFNSTTLEIIRDKVQRLAVEGGSMEILDALCTSCLGVLAGKLEVDSLLPPVKGLVKEIETAHNYSDNEDRYWRVTIPSATKLRITFDERSSTEMDCDTVKIYKGGDRRTVLGGPYHGRRSSSEKNFPGVNRPCLWVDGNDIEVYFHSDSSNNDWGFKMKIVGIVSVPTSDQVKAASDKMEEFNCTPSGVDFSCWMLKILSSAPRARGFMRNAKVFRILRKFLMAVKGPFRVRIVGVLSELLDPEYSSKAKDSSYWDEAVKIVQYMIESTDKIIRDEASSGKEKSQMLQAMVECSVKGYEFVGGDHLSLENITCHSEKRLELTANHRVPFWLMSVVDSTSILRSFESRTVPDALLTKEILPKKTKENSCVIESEHPIKLKSDANSEEEPKTTRRVFSGAKKVAVTFLEDCRMPPRSVIVIRGANGRSERRLRELDQATEDGFNALANQGICVNDMVDVGPDWKWGNTHSGYGTVTSIVKWKGEERKGVNVKWTNGGSGLYRWGYDGNFDLRIVGVGDRSTKGIVIEGDEVEISVVTDSGEQQETDDLRTQDADAWRGALRLQASTGLAIPYSHDVDFLGDFSLCMWFRVESADDNPGTTCLICREAGFGDADVFTQFKVSISHGSSKERMNLELVMGNAEASPGDGCRMVIRDLVSVGRWTNFLLKAEGSKIYLSGGDQVRASSSSRGIITVDSQFDGERMGPPMNADITIGESFSGHIAELKGWSRALTYSEQRMAILGKSLDGGGEIFAFPMRNLAAPLENRVPGPVKLAGKGSNAGNLLSWFVDAGVEEIRADGRAGTEVDGRADCSYFGWKCEMKPVYALEGISEEERNLLELDYRVGSLKHDEALVRYVNVISVKKGFDTGTILRAAWDDISPLMDDLTRSPLLRDLAQLERGEDGTTVNSSKGNRSESRESCAVVVDEAASKRGAKQFMKPILARWKMIQAANKCLSVVLPLVDMSTCNKEGTLASLISNMRRLIFRGIKLPLWEAALKATSNSSDSMFEMKISRSRARKNIRNGMCDTHGRWTCFGQAFRQMHRIPPRNLRRGGQLYNTTFMGERAHDAGGPYSETFCEYAAELQSAALPLFIQAPNGRHAVGMNRDAWIPNPGSFSIGGEGVSQMYAFCGKIFGICVRSRDYLNLTFPSIVWKRLCNERVDISDLEAIDTCFVKSMESIRNIHKEGITAESFGSIIFESFETLGSDDRKLELLQGGSQREVTFENREEFCDLATKFRLEE